MHKLLSSVAAMVLLLAALGGGLAQAADPAPSRRVVQPAALTMADNDATVEMVTGSTFVLQLGESPPEWEVKVDDPAILSRVVNILVVKGAQGVYRADQPGTTQLTAVGIFGCQKGPIRCMIASPVFRVTVVVKPPAPKQVRFSLGQTTYTADGQAQPMDVASILENGRVYVPVRFLAQALGASAEDITWEPAGQAVTLQVGSTQLALHVGSSDLYVNQTPVAMAAPAVLQGGRVLVPVRFVAEALGYQVTWDAAAQAALLAR